MTFRLIGGLLARLGWRAFVCPTCGRRFRSFGAVEDVDGAEAGEPSDA